MILNTQLKRGNFERYTPKFQSVITAKVEEHRIHLSSTPTPLEGLIKERLPHIFRSQSKLSGLSKKQLEELHYAYFPQIMEICIELQDQYQLKELAARFGISYTKFKSWKSRIFKIPDKKYLSRSWLAEHVRNTDFYQILLDKTTFKRSLVNLVFKGAILANYNHCTKQDPDLNDRQYERDARMNRSTIDRLLGPHSSAMKKAISSYLPHSQSTAVIIDPAIVKRIEDRMSLLQSTQVSEVTVSNQRLQDIFSRLGALDNNFDIQGFDYHFPETWPKAWYVAYEQNKLRIDNIAIPTIARFKAVITDLYYRSLIDDLEVFLPAQDSKLIQLLGKKLEKHFRWFTYKDSRDIITDLQNDRKALTKFILSNTGDTKIGLKVSNNHDFKGRIGEAEGYIWKLSDLIGYITKDSDTKIDSIEDALHMVVRHASLTPVRNGFDIMIAIPSNRLYDPHTPGSPLLALGENKWFNYQLDILSSLGGHYQTGLDFMKKFTSIRHHLQYISLRAMLDLDEAEEIVRHLHHQYLRDLDIARFNQYKQYKNDAPILQLEKIDYTTGSKHYSVIAVDHIRVKWQGKFRKTLKKLPDKWNDELHKKMRIIPHVYTTKGSIDRHAISRLTLDKYSSNPNGFVKVFPNYRDRNGKVKRVSYFRTSLGTNTTIYATPTSDGQLELNPYSSHHQRIRVHLDRVSISRGHRAFSEVIEHAMKTRLNIIPHKTADLYDMAGTGLVKYDRDHNYYYLWAYTTSNLQKHQAQKLILSRGEKSLSNEYLALDRLVGLISASDPSLHPAGTEFIDRSITSMKNHQRANSGFSNAAFGSSYRNHMVIEEYLPIYSLSGDPSPVLSPLVAEILVEMEKEIYKLQSKGYHQVDATGRSIPLSDDVIEDVMYRLYKRTEFIHDTRINRRHQVMLDQIDLRIETVERQINELGGKLISTYSEEKYLKMSFSKLGIVRKNSKGKKEAVLNGLPLNGSGIDLSQIIGFKITVLKFDYTSFRVFLNPELTKFYIYDSKVEVWTTRDTLIHDVKKGWILNPDIYRFVNHKNKNSIRKEIESQRLIPLTNDDSSSRDVPVSRNRLVSLIIMNNFLLSELRKSRNQLKGITGRTKFMAFRSAYKVSGYDIGTYYGLYKDKTIELLEWEALERQFDRSFNFQLGLSTISISKLYVESYQNIIRKNLDSSNPNEFFKGLSQLSLLKLHVNFTKRREIKFNNRRTIHASIFSEMFEYTNQSNSTVNHGIMRPSDGDLSIIGTNLVKKYDLINENGIGKKGRSSDAFTIVNNLIYWNDYQISISNSLLLSSLLKNFQNPTDSSTSIKILEEDIDHLSIEEISLLQKYHLFLKEILNPQIDRHSILSKNIRRRVKSFKRQKITEEEFIEASVLNLKIIFGDRIDKIDSREIWSFHIDWILDSLNL